MLTIAVIGAGAVGLALGATAHAAGERVVFVVRPGGREPLARHGVLRTGLFGEARIEPGKAEAVESVAGLAGLALDHLLVCVKSVACESLARELADAWPRLAGPRRVVCVQNGWGVAELFADRLPREAVFSARVITGFRRAAPHVSEVTVHADPIRIGSLFGADPACLAPLCRSLSRGGIPAAVSPDVARDLWSKLLYNCALNPLGALLEVPYGVLGERATTRRVIEAVVREVFAVMAAAGFASHWAAPEAYLRALHEELLPPTARHESSMLQDLRAGRPTEVEFLSGAVARIGTEHGVATPVSVALRDLVRAAALRRRRGRATDGAP